VSTKFADTNATTTATATALATATATATKVDGNVWVTGQWLAAAGEDGWWRWISLSLFDYCFFKWQMLVVVFFHKKTILSTLDFIYS
jgi:hypothetical protein